MSLTQPANRWQVADPIVSLPKITQIVSQPGEPIVVSAVGIGTSEAFGAQAITLKVAPSGIPTTEAFGTATLKVTLRPSGIASAETFGQTTVTLGGVSITIYPTGIPSAEAFGTATLKLTLMPTGTPSGETFGAPQVLAKIGAVGIASEEAFGSLIAALVGAITLYLNGIASEEAFGTPSLVWCYPPMPSVPAHTIMGMGGGGGEAPAPPKVKMYPLSGDKPFRPRNMSGDRWKRSLGKKTFKGMGGGIG